MNQRAEAVSPQELKSPYIQGVIDRLVDISLYGPHVDKRDQRVVVGVAAPQIGVAKQIIVVDVALVAPGDQRDLRIYINPRIASRSAGATMGREGCLSTGEVAGIVERNESITLEALDRSGRLVSEKWGDFQSRRMQHEVDHLLGIRFPDRITDPNRMHWVEYSEYAAYREHWRNWPKKCSFDEWRKIKSR